MSNVSSGKSRPSFSMELRGRQVEVECHPIAADHSVGQQNDFEDESITDEETGEVLDWELTDDEREKVNRHIDDWAASWEESW